jgi:TolB-like protein
MAGDEGVGKSSEADGQPSGAPAPVFISYASQDAAVANSIVENLEQHGIKCWFAPRDVAPGSQYADEIVGAINDAKVFVLVLSEHAVASPHVGRELERAASKRRRIIVLRTDAAPLTRSFEYFLSESQWLDVAALGVAAALTKLTQAAGQSLAPSSWVSSGFGTDVRDPADRKRKPSYLTIRRVVAAAVFLFVAAVVVGVMIRYWPSKQGISQAPVMAAMAEKSIAVLPFTDMSEKKDQEYFGDGMAEEIIDLLVKIPGLKVISRTSSFQFKGKTEGLRSIATQLGVAYVLEGSVRKSGDHLRVTAQLVNSLDGSQLWSQGYDRDLNDVLKMQDEIATKVVRALQIEVNPNGTAYRRTLGNTEAYTLYLKGLHAFDRYDQQGLDRAVSYFQQALALDPSFAAAAGELAYAYFSLGGFGFIPPAVADEPARNAAELALKLDPNHAGAHAVLGSIYLGYDWDWPAADREFTRARALAPSDAHVLSVSVGYSFMMGRSDEALKFANACLEHSPLEPLCYSFLGEIQASRGRWAEAEAANRRALEISPTFGFPHSGIGRTLLARGQPEAALAEFSKEPLDAPRLAGSAMTYFVMGRKTDSDAALAALKDQSNDSLFVAEVYAFRGESDEAFKWLERAYAEKDHRLAFIKVMPTLKRIEGDARYKAFLKKMNLPYD